MDKKRISNVKAKEFFKKNIYYFIIALCLASVITMITLTCVNQQNIKNNIEPVAPVNNNTDNTDVVKPGDNITDPVDQTPTDPVDQTPTDPVDNPTIPSDSGKPSKPSNPGDTTTVVPIVFAAPVGSVNILKDYTMDSLVWNSTLKQYQVNDNIIFGGEEGTNVLAAADGEVIAISYDVLKGNQLSIRHNEKLVSVYASLKDTSVVVGDIVSKGDVIGTMGNTATDEYILGAQVQFSAFEEGNTIDPNLYLTIGSK
ncbi:MAG: peptidoglycan DD-metalloendopeptidase family protein [Clostridia bacterium]